MRRQRDEEGNLAERLGRPPLGEDALQQAGGARAGLRHVDMRIGAEDDQRVGLVRHQRRDIGVQVEARHQRDVRADDGAHAAQKLAFAVLQMFGHHRAVEVQIDGVHGPRAPQVVHDHAGDALIGLLLDLGGGAGIRPGQRREVAARGARRLQEARYRQVYAGGIGKNGLAPAEPRPAVGAPEHLEACLCRRKCIGLMVKLPLLCCVPVAVLVTANRNPHGPRLQPRPATLANP